MKKHINVSIEKIKQFFNHTKEWSNPIIMFITFFGLIFNYYSTNRSINIATNTIEQVKEQLLLQKKAIPSQFNINFFEAGTINERAVIVNTGKTKLTNLSAEYIFYFVTPEYKVYTQNSLPNEFEKDTSLFNKAKLSNLFKYNKDIKGLLGINNIFRFNEVLPEDKFMCQGSSFCCMNALKLAKSMNTQVFMKWTIYYNDEFANKRNSSTLNIWLHEPNLLHLPVGHEDFQRENLVDVLGGKKVMDAIENYDQNSPEEIFGK